MIVEVYRSSVGTLGWRDDCFWQFNAEPNHEATGLDLELLAERVRSFSKGKKAPLLIDRTSSYSTALSGVTLFSKVAPELFSAIAYHAPSKHADTAAKFIRDLFLRGLPVEIFSHEADAVRWIRDHLKP